MQSFGLINLWTQGDFVTRTVAVFLLLMSFSSWVVMLTKAWELSRLKKMANAAEKQFWHADTFPQALQTLGETQENPFFGLAQAAQEAATHSVNQKPHLHNAMDLSDWMTRCLKSAMDESIAKMQAGLALLASVGSTAPFVGLFGTVWGIYHALIGIGTAGIATIDKVAGPVGEALIMTALGLAVAIPAVLGYNALTRANKGVIGKLNRFAHDLHAYFVTGARVGASANKTAVSAAINKD